MAILTLDDLKQQLNLTADFGDGDDVLLRRKLDAAESYMARRLGYALETEYPEGVPPELKEAVLQLAAHWYENREGVLVGVSAQPLPSGIDDIIRDYRNWSF